MRRRALLLLTLASVACSKRQESARNEGASEQSASGERPSGKLIVVLGSSTSAGTGPSKPEHAWVPRYAAHLGERFPDFKVVNLAVGGQTTYHIQPDGYVPPAGRPAPTSGKNISAALAFAPRALIVNMPSNDSAEGFSVAEQLANFERVAALATGAGVPLWLTTTQPRNFGKAAQLDAQVRVRDAILQKYAPRTLDFWTPFATSNRTLNPQYDAGDGTHLNDQAHARLLSIVVAAHIPEAVESSSSKP
jgi:lysophospholipase L1-like esterase